MTLVVVRKADPTGAARALTATEREYLRSFRNAIAMVEDQLREQSVLTAIASRNPDRVLSAIDWSAMAGAFSRVPDALTRQITEAANSAIRELAGNVAMRFDMTNPMSIAWAEQRAGRLIAQITDEQRQLVRSYVMDAVRGGYTVDQTAARLESVVGLHDRWARAVDSNYQATFASVLDATGDPMRAAARATETAMKYRDRLVSSRARTIARTEIVQAHNRGRYQAWQEAVDQEFLDPRSQKEWVATDDERTCEICGPLDGERVQWDEPFSTGDDMPDAHPNCRCTAIVLPPPSSPSPAASPTASEPDESPATVTPSAPADTRAWADITDRAERQAVMQADFDAIWNPIAEKHGLTITRADVYTGADGGATVAYRLEGPQGIIRYERMVDMVEGNVDHEFFKMSAALQGSGIATDVNTAAFDMYRLRGIKTVTVHANIDVGGYTWAKQGFVWDTSKYSEERLQNQIKGFARGILKRSSPGTPAYRAALDIDSRVRSANTADWPSPLEIAMAGHEDGAKTWQGKEVMLGSDWYGILHL